MKRMTKAKAARQKSAANGQSMDNSMEVINPTNGHPNTLVADGEGSPLEEVVSADESAHPTVDKSENGTSTNQEEGTAADGPVPAPGLPPVGDEDDVPWYTSDPKGDTTNGAQDLNTTPLLDSAGSPSDDVLGQANGRQGRKSGNVGTFRKRLLKDHLGIDLSGDGEHLPEVQGEKALTDVAVETPLSDTEETPASSEIEDLQPIPITHREATYEDMEHMLGGDESESFAASPNGQGETDHGHEDEDEDETEDEDDHSDPSGDGTDGETPQGPEDLQRDDTIPFPLPEAFKETGIRGLPIHVTGGQNMDEVIQAILLREHDQYEVPLDLIDFYSKNRKLYKPGTLEELAANIAKVGLINEIIIRPMPNGRFELVAGERRVRATRLAGLTKIRSKIYELSDNEARQIRVSENTQREDLHPMEEAFAMGEMLEDFPAVELIAKQLGKTVPYVQNRLKLLSLVGEAQEMVLADLITIREAQELAAFEDAIQHSFITTNFKNWREKGKKGYFDFSYAIKRLKGSLKNPPFDPEDVTLNPKMGACSGCQYNSACQQYLFAEVATDPQCNNLTCYNAKTTQQLVKNMTSAVIEHKPMAIVSDMELTDDQKALIKDIPGTEGLSFFQERMVRKVFEPSLPLEENYTDEKGKLDKKRFTEKMADYKEAVAYQEAAIKNRKIMRALFIHRNGAVDPYMFTQDSKASLNGQSGKVALVQEDIKNGIATTEQILGELSRIRQIEESAKEDDQREINENIFSSLQEKINSVDNVVAAMPLDTTIDRWVSFNALDEDQQEEIIQRIFPETWERISPTDKVAVLENLSEDQVALLKRMALLRLSDYSDSDDQVTGLLVSRLSEQMGVDIPSIQKIVDDNAKDRIQKFQRNEAELIKKANKKKKKRKAEDDAMVPPAAPETATSGQLEESSAGMVSGNDKKTGKKDRKRKKAGDTPASIETPEVVPAPGPLEAPDNSSSPAPDEVAQPQDSPLVDTNESLGQTEATTEYPQGESELEKLLDDEPEGEPTTLSPLSSEELGHAQPTNGLSGTIKEDPTGESDEGLKQAAHGFVNEGETPESIHD